MAPPKAKAKAKAGGAPRPPMEPKAKAKVKDKASDADRPASKPTAPVEAPRPQLKRPRGGTDAPVATAKSTAEASQPPRKRLRTGASASAAPAATAAAKPSPAEARATLDAAPPQAPIAAGDKVFLVGLQKCPELNGVLGTAASFSPEKGRWQVVLDCGRGTHNVLPANIASLGAPRAVPPPPPAAASQAAPLAAAEASPTATSTPPRKSGRLAAAGSGTGSRPPRTAFRQRVVAGRNDRALRGTPPAEPKATAGSSAAEAATCGASGVADAGDAATCASGAVAPAATSEASRAGSRPRAAAGRGGGVHRATATAPKRPPAAAPAATAGETGAVGAPGSGSIEETARGSGRPRGRSRPTGRGGGRDAAPAQAEAPAPSPAEPQPQPLVVEQATVAHKARAKTATQERRGGGAAAKQAAPDTPTAGVSRKVEAASPGSAKRLGKVISKGGVSWFTVVDAGGAVMRVQVTAGKVGGSPEEAARVAEQVLQRVRSEGLNKEQAMAFRNELYERFAGGQGDSGDAPEAAPPPPPPPRKRLRNKSCENEEGAVPVAQLISKLAADGEAEELAASQGSAAAHPPAGKASAKEAKRAAAAVEAEIKAAMKCGEEAEELDGEKKRAGGRAAAPPRKCAADGDDDDEDKLFDDDEDLEGEEAISEASDPEPDDDEDGDITCEAWKPVGALPWPDVWGTGRGQLQPGHKGFNEYAAECIAKAHLGGPHSPFATLGLRLHQESAAFLVHPSSPIQRLLVDHATGTGKTLIMLRILDNFFDDPRPKVAIFPKDTVCDNFYQELLKWPTRWRHFFSFARPAHASLASGAKDWRRKKADVWDMGNERLRNEAKSRGVRLEKIIRELVDSIREVLEMKNAIHKGKVKPKFARKFLEEHRDAPVPRAPLRAFRYTTAGGCACDLGDDGWPRSPILKVGFDPEELNPYSGKVVIMDEAHNLVRPTLKYEEQLGRLGGHLRAAQGTVLAGFTGTPVGNDAREGRALLDTIKGQAAEHLTDEGFVSSFHARGSKDFPREEPVKGIPDGIIHEGMFEELVKKHNLHGEALKRYILKEAEYQITPRLLRLPEEKRVARLANYCCLHVHYGAFHTANRTAMINDVKGHAPKMHAVVKSLIKRPEKTVVMMAREMGFKAMLEVLQKTGKKHGFKVATLAELGDFNDARRNLRGERFRVLAAETNHAGEGIQFRHVRRIHLLDVPLRHSDLVQRTSRCVRLGGHEDLPAEERTLSVEMHVSVLPKLLRQGPSSLIYRELVNAKDVTGTPGTSLEAATEACLKVLRKRGVKTLTDLQKEVQADPGGEALIELLTETALEELGNTNNAPARPLAMALWRLRRGGDDLEALEKALLNQVQTADEVLVDWLVDKSAELLPPLEAMRLGAVDRELLRPLGDPPAAPPPPQQRSERALAKAAQRRADALAQIEPNARPPEATADAAGAPPNAAQGGGAEAAGSAAGGSPDAMEEDVDLEDLDEEDPDELGGELDLDEADLDEP